MSHSKEHNARRVHTPVQATHIPSGLAVSPKLVPVTQGVSALIVGRSSAVTPTIVQVSYYVEYAVQNQDNLLFVDIMYGYPSGGGQTIFVELTPNNNYVDTFDGIRSHGFRYIAFHPTSVAEAKAQQFFYLVVNGLPPHSDPTQVDIEVFVGTFSKPKLDMSGNDRQIATVRLYASNQTPPKPPPDGGPF